MEHGLTDEALLEEGVDLTSCDREPIHILGRVQSFGALLSVTPDWIVNHASDNIEDFVGRPHAAVVGRPLNESISAEAIHDLRGRLQFIGTDDVVERLFEVQLRPGGPKHDVAIHVSGRSIVLELERSSDVPDKDYNAYVRPMIQRLGKAADETGLCDIAVKQMRSLTGFDRAMVYRFEPDGTGVVVAEARKGGMEPFLGLRYPASDIPKQARAMYKRNLLRLIADVNDTGRAIRPARSPEGEPLDLSLSVTRAVSPIHLEYLRNMGVEASMSVSILRRGELWGLFACHHDSPRTVPYDVRTAVELYAQLFSFILDQVASDAEREDTARARILHDQIMAQLAENQDIAANFGMIVSAVKTVVPFDGAVCWTDGRFLSEGFAPSEAEFMRLVPILNTTASGKVFASDHLARVLPEAEGFSNRVAGLLALPISRTPRDYIVLFRREIAQSVTWAGNPDKPVEPGPNGIRLTPRKSFEAWQQVVRNQCAPWQPSEIVAAEILRTTLLEVVLRMTDTANRERARSQERQEILIAELNHRVRNILNLIRSLVTQTQSGTSTVSDFTQVIGGRIHALGRAHDQITRENWSPASLRELIATETVAYLGDESGRVVISGANPFLEPAAFTTVSLVVHELVTNSVKYGALSERMGRVIIALSEQSDGSLSIDWQEQGGPPITEAPTRRGFGTTIIERSIPYELKGRAEVQYGVGGLQATFWIPQPFVSRFAVADVAADAAVAPARDAAQAVSGDVLLVEDNLVIAMDAEAALEELGARTVHMASNVEDALRIVDAQPLAMALLDINLGSETSHAIALALKERGVRFAFATGYGDTTSITKSFPDAPVVQKPYDRAMLADAFSRAGPR